MTTWKTVAEAHQKLVGRGALCGSWADAHYLGAPLPQGDIDWLVPVEHWGAVATDWPGHRLRGWSFGHHLGGWWGQVWLEFHKAPMGTLAMCEWADTPAGPILCQSPHLRMDSLRYILTLKPLGPRSEVWLQAKRPRFQTLITQYQTHYANTT
jgi:hypothetical protein